MRGYAVVKKEWENYPQCLWCRANYSMSIRETLTVGITFGSRSMKPPVNYRRDKVCRSVDKTNGKQCLITAHCPHRKERDYFFVFFLVGDSVPCELELRSHPIIKPNYSIIGLLNHILK